MASRRNDQQRELARHVWWFLSVGVHWLACHRFIDLQLRILSHSLVTASTCCQVCCLHCLGDCSIVLVPCPSCILQTTEWMREMEHQLDSLTWGCWSFAFAPVFGKPLLSTKSQRSLWFLGRMELQGLLGSKAKDCKYLGVSTDPLRIKSSIYLIYT